MDRPLSIDPALDAVLQSRDPGGVLALLRRDRARRFDLGGVALLLSRGAAECLESLASRAKRLTEARFGRVIQMYAPLYLSNACVNVCHYCGFSLENRVVRRTLRVPEILREWDVLRSWGFRNVLLVSGEDPRTVPVDYLEATVRSLRPLAASIAVEVAPLSQDQYRRLAAAGADGVVLYQETYDAARYAEVHPRGPKRDFLDRVGSIARAAEAGVRKLGMGVLLGLADWRADALRLVAHVREVERRFWRSEISVSVPRLRPAAGGYVPHCPVSDRELVQLVLALRLSLPEAGICLSTREPPWLRDTLVGLGVTHLSAGSRTEPGGYAGPGDGAPAERQFAISDERSPREVARRIRELGYEPVWKDWDALLGRGPKALEAAHA